MRSSSASRSMPPGIDGVGWELNRVRSLRNRPRMRDRLLVRISSHNHGCIVPAESERVGEGDIDALLAGLVWHVVQVARRIGCLVIDGGLNHVVLDRERVE